ncbi:MAG: hypothetical protein E6Q24_21245 [Chitinophagaceae bacterium]|nr:MAG: hypothetical protein E6Q24_21245 [Chitinophagaceae bacterium]
MELIDAAFEAFKQIKIDAETHGHSILSEQDTRLKIVDRIVSDVLGYNLLQDVSTEPASGSGFIDYLIKIKETGRLVIEAKKEAVDFEIKALYSGRAYNLNGATFHARAVRDGLAQTIYYAAQESVELGCLTNGNTWIIFRANRLGDGKRPMDGRAFVFSDLQSIEANFKVFYELLSKQCVENLLYRAIFQEAEGQEVRVKDFAESLVKEDNLRLMTADFTSDFERVMNIFFSKLSGDDDPEFLSNCFVETKESQAAEYQLARISEELVSKVKAIETSQGEAIRKIIERIKNTNRQEFIILVGSKGAGKSTFVDRFFNYVLSSNLKDECIVVKVNLAGYSGSEQEITNWLDSTLLEATETVLYNGAPTNDEIQGIFFGEYNRYKRAHKVLYETERTKFKIEFAKHMEARRESRPTEYIQKLIGNIVRSRQKVPCIVFDNADHFSIDIQEKVFQYGRSIYENKLCLVIVPITDKTSWQLSKQGAIKSYENEVMFLPTPSPKRIIEKRIEYLDGKIEIEKRHKAQYFFKKGITIELRDIEGFVKLLQTIFLQDHRTSKWIGSFSNFDIRTSLEITRDIISSPHLSIGEFLKAYVVKSGSGDNEEDVIKPYRIKNALVKRRYNSYPVKHHPYVQNLYYCNGDVNTSPLLSIRVLQVLKDRKQDTGAADSFFSVSQLIGYFHAMTVEQTTIHKTLQFLLSHGLIRSYDPSIIDIDYSKKVEVTPSGLEHYYWAINDIDFAYIMLEVTPICDRDFFDDLNASYNTPNNKFRLTKLFLDYLEREDATYCKVPNHPSYDGQKVIHIRFDWLRQVLERKINGYQRNRVTRRT